MLINYVVSSNALGCQPQEGARHPMIHHTYLIKSNTDRPDVATDLPTVAALIDAGIIKFHAKKRRVTHEGAWDERRYVRVRDNENVRTSPRKP
jgi:hypothetical protein